MKAFQHALCNDVIEVPKGHDQEKYRVNAIPLMRTHVGGTPAVASFWKPSEEELQQLRNGASVALWLIGHTMPPAAIEVQP